MTGFRGIAVALAGVVMVCVMLAAERLPGGEAGRGLLQAARPEPVDPQALAQWWDTHHLPLPSAPLMTHADVTGAVSRAVEVSNGQVRSEVIGQSVEGRDLYHLTYGSGPMHVLLWSQMHGDEPTATRALFDVLEWLRRESAAPAAEQIADRLTLHLVPMLNPDGAQRFQRRNAQGIDVNRDALRLQTPEGRALKALRDRIEPVLGFNLHNQNWGTSVGSPPRPASISLLAVAHDEARSDSPRRIRAKKTAALIRDVLERFIPGQIGRYSDEFEVRAFGDNIGRWGTGVVLIETGPLAGPDPDRELVRLNFVAILSALDGLASGRVEAADVERYESLPHNDNRLLHALVTEATVIAGTGVPPFIADIGLSGQRSVQERDGRRVLRVAHRIADLGDLRVYGALERIDAAGLTAVPLVDEQVKAGDEIRLPDWGTWKGPTLSVGQPGRFLLVEPVPERDGTWRVVRRVGE
ncbi:MAG TPA: M14 family metallopeptidase [Vicinamibacterales bacterium]